MSGGSMDYVCYRVADAATMTHDPEFSELLRDASKVLVMGRNRNDGTVERRRYVPERTCKFVSSRGPDCPPVCSACGYELDLYECLWFEDGTYGYGGNCCPCCGSKVVGSDEAEEV